MIKTTEYNGNQHLQPKYMNHLKIPHSERFDIMKKILYIENINNKIWEDYQITYSAALLLKRDDLGTSSKISSTINDNFPC